MASRFYVETLGCPKNEVDSEKLIGTLLAQGLTATDDESQADVVVVNTCAFIEDARKESIDTIMALSERRKKGARLVVTGCMAERYGDELRANLPEADQIAGFGVAIETGVVAAATTTSVALGKKPSLSVSAEHVPSFDLLNLPRPASKTPWAY
ncbi:MAG: 30S ribosomal protein S12 methylthiotransferase RimO, partial [Actinomycetota bacterium]